MVVPLRRLLLVTPQEMPDSTIGERLEFAPIIQQCAPALA